MKTDRSAPLTMPPFAGNGDGDASVITVRELTKTYDELEAVRRVSFDVSPGEVFGFLGPNGAGKSTTINVLCTLLRPTSGQARVNGFDVQKQPGQVRRSIGIIFQDPSLDDRLSARENLEFHARIYNLPRTVWKERQRDLVKTFS